MMDADPVICLFGFGEVGQTLARDLHQRGSRRLIAWDIAFAAGSDAPQRTAASGLAAIAPSARDAVADATLVISAVTAANCEAAAREAGAAMRPGAFLMDLNSVAPKTRANAAGFVDGRGMRYVEAAVMAPIGPKGIATSMLLGGAHAAAFFDFAQELGFTGARPFSPQIGRASAAKMCRSVMVKGMEALLTESLLSARHYGVERTVVDSLSNLFPGLDWPTLGGYMISRSLQHGRRRAEEMREVARTVHDAGIEPHMSMATVHRQDWAAAFGRHADVRPIEALLDSLLSDVDGKPMNAPSLPSPACGGGEEQTGGFLQ